MRAYARRCMLPIVRRRFSKLPLRDQTVPIISTFFGIVIRMFYKEHEPAHFHAEHQGQMAKCNFEGEIIAGYIRSRTARTLIRKWAVTHRSELEANWDKMKQGQALDRIEPLE